MSEEHNNIDYELLNEKELPRSILDAKTSPTHLECIRNMDNISSGSDESSIHVTCSEFSSLYDPHQPTSAKTNTRFTGERKFIIPCMEESLDYEGLLGSSDNLLYDCGADKQDSASHEDTFAMRDHMMRPLVRCKPNSELRMVCNVNHSPRVTSNFDVSYNDVPKLETFKKRAGNDNIDSRRQSKIHPSSLTGRNAPVKKTNIVSNVLDQPISTMAWVPFGKDILLGVSAAAILMCIKNRFM